MHNKTSVWGLEHAEFSDFALSVDSVVFRKCWLEKKYTVSVNYKIIIINNNKHLSLLNYILILSSQKQNKSDIS